MKVEAWVTGMGGQRQEPPQGGSRQTVAGRLADPEVIPTKAPRQRRDTAYKLRIAEEAERCKHRRGERAALARREGLYHCTLTKWMQWRLTMREKGLDVTPEGPRQPSLRKELKRLARENERLKAKLRRAQGLIDLQKKVSRQLKSLRADEPSER